MFFLCLKIFLARIIDVSLGTVRTIFVVKNEKALATIFAFAEVMVWFFAAREALNTDGPIWLIALSYSLGYASGTYIGTLIDDLFIKGVVNIEVISNNITNKEIGKIKDKDFGVTVLKSVDNKKFLFIIVDKKRMHECLKMLKMLDNEAFIIVNNSHSTYNGYIKK